MARLTNADRQALRTALAHAERALAYINAPDTALAHRSSYASTTLHYTRADGQTLYEVDKEIGSDLTGLPACISALGQFLATH